MNKFEKLLVTDTGTIEEVDEEQHRDFADQTAWKENLFNFGVRLSSTHFGQFVVKQTDNLLWTVEKTAKWSCPSDEINVKKPKCKPAALVRPLPWILFLPALLSIRCTRTLLSILSVLLGYDPIAPADAVSSIQWSRRKLRAVKYQGLRNIRMQHEDAELSRMLNEGVRDNDGGFLQDILATVVRGICSQRPDILDSVRIMMVKPKRYSKCSLNASVNNKDMQSQKRNRHEVDESDSESEEDIDYKTLLNQTFLEDTESDDENFNVESNKEDYTSSDSSISSQEKVFESHEPLEKNTKNDDKQNEQSVSKQLNDGDNNTNTNHAPIENDDSANKWENGAVLDTENASLVNSEQVKAIDQESTQNPNKQMQPTKHSRKTKSPTSGSRKSPVANATLPTGSSAHTHHRQHNHNNRNKNNRIHGQNNGEHSQTIDAGTGQTNTSNAKQYNNSNNNNHGLGAKTSKRSV